MVGGVKKEAKQSDIRIYRQKLGSSEPELIRVNLAAVKKREQPDVLLKPFDIIEVPEASIVSKSRLAQTLANGLFGGISSMTSSFGTYLPMRVIY
jgi:hypothetical protein